MMKKILPVSITLLFVSILMSGQQVNNENLKITHGPYIQNLSPGEVTVIWHTNLPAIPSLLISGKRGDSRLVQNSSDGIIDGGGTMHKVKVTDLEPGSEYSYTTVSKQVMKYQAYRIYYGDTLKGREITFRTPDPEARRVSFTVFNDIHENADLLSSFLASKGAKNAELYSFNGDMIAYLQDESQLFSGFIDTAVSRFASSKPFYYVRGNHETRGMLARDLKQFFDFPSGRFYYSFTRGPVRFIVLDCGEDKPDSNRYYYGLADYDNYRLEELEWLNRELDAGSSDATHFTVVIIHMPVIKGEKQGYGMQFLSEHFGPVLSGAGIDLMISGHTHRTAFISKDRSGFNYPVLISSNRTFIEFSANERELSWELKDSEGNIVESGSVK